MMVAKQTKTKPRLQVVGAAEARGAVTAEAKPIARGDLVRLKSGSGPMTVAGIIVMDGIDYADVVFAANHHGPSDHMPFKQDRLPLACLAAEPAL